MAKKQKDKPESEKKTGPVTSTAGTQWVPPLGSGFTK